MLLVVFLFEVIPSGHLVSIQRRFNVNAMSRRFYNVTLTRCNLALTLMDII